MKDKIKEYLPIYLGFVSMTWGVYFLIWICVMFVNLEIINPFYWFVHLTDLEPKERGLMLAIYLTVKWVQILGTYAEHNKIKAQC
jgi:hypothetical protein